MNSSIELELQNLRSALTRLEDFLRANPEYCEQSCVQDDLENFASDFEDMVDSHLGNN